MGPGLMGLGPLGQMGPGPMGPNGPGPKWAHRTQMGPGPNGSMFFFVQGYRTCQLMIHRHFPNPEPLYPSRYDIKLYLASWTCREKHLYNFHRWIHSCHAERGYSTKVQILLPTSPRCNIQFKVISPWIDGSGHLFI